ARIVPAGAVLNGAFSPRLPFPFHVWVASPVCRFPAVLIAVERVRAAVGRYLFLAPLAVADHDASLSRRVLFFWSRASSAAPQRRGSCNHRQAPIGRHAPPQATKTARGKNPGRDTA